MKDAEDYALAVSLRLAVLFYRNRGNIVLPTLHGHFSGTRFRLSIDANWLTQNPLTEAALQEEVLQWEVLGVSMQIVPE